MPQAKRPTPPHLLVFLAAFRWQESGTPFGNYKEPNGEGAYGMTAPFWSSWAPKLGIDTGRYPTASSAPKKLQDRVAAHVLTDYYYGVAEKSWRLVARTWNGGTPEVRSNPALGNTNVYADQVLQKASTITPKAAAGYEAGTSVSLKDATTKGQLRKLRKYGRAVAAEQAPCAHQLSLNLKVTSAHICMDKPIAFAAFAGGGALVLAGVTILLVTGFKDTAAGRAAKGAAAAVPVGRALTAARRTTGAVRPSQSPRGSTSAAGSAAAAEVPTAAARRATEAAERERRREELHRQQLRHRRQLHADRRQRASAAEVRRRTLARPGRSEPGLGYEPPTRRPRAKPKPLPDKPPF